jgi:hypothetical protein
LAQAQTKAPVIRGHYSGRLSQADREHRINSHRRRQKLIEAKALKLSYCSNGSGVLIKKEHNQMALLLDDAQELAEKLTDFLTKPRS